MNHLEKSRWLSDWYVVRGSLFGDPEGTAEEWRTVIAGMKEKKPYVQGGRRVAARINTNGDVEFYSPRNSTGPYDFAEVDAADVPAWIERAEMLLAEAVLA